MDQTPILDLVFVYGTLRPSVPQSRHQLLQPAQLIGSGSVVGRLFNLDGYPGAVPTEDATSRVRGEVYRLSDPTGALRRMDRYEGFVPETPLDCEFRRERVRVTFDSGESRETWIYFYNLSTDALTLIPGGDYATFLQQQSSQQQ